MSLSEVYMTNDLYMACLQLALSTEKEEVIGLLIGKSKEENGKEVAHISTLKIPHRLDKKKDRVEISMQQLVAAADHAAELTQKYGKEMRVLGWYHSHPHITVWPSHVDVKTQAMYQLMDKGFLGIICSVFSEDKATKDCEVNLTCFQSKTLNNSESESSNVRVEVPLHIVPTSLPFINCLELICELPKILLEEELDSYKTIETDKLDIYSQLHNKLVLTKSLCHMIDHLSLPLLKTLEKRNQILMQRCKVMRQQRSQSSQEITNENNSY